MMSWHTIGIFIQKDYSADVGGMLGKLGLNGAIPQQRVSFDGATCGDDEGVAVGVIDGWTVLWGGVAMYGVDEDGLAEIAKKVRIFQILLEGTSGTAGFTWWAGGKCVRDWMSQEGEVFKNEGTPLPEEKRAFAKRDHEQAVLQLLTSLTVPFQRLESIEYRMYEIPEDSVPDER
jgi:hypothetical protein